MDLDVINHTALHLLPRRYAAFAVGAGRLPGCVAGGEAIGVTAATGVTNASVVMKPVVGTPLIVMRLTLSHSASFAGSVLSAFVSAASRIWTNCVPRLKLTASCFVALTRPARAAPRPSLERRKLVAIHDRASALGAIAEPHSKFGMRHQLALSRTAERAGTGDSTRTSGGSYCPTVRLRMSGGRWTACRTSWRRASTSASSRSLTSTAASASRSRWRARSAGATSHGC